MNKFSKFKFAEELKSQNKKLCDTFFIFSKGAEDRSYVVFEQYVETIAPERIIMLDSRLRNEALSSTDMVKYDRIQDIVLNKGISVGKTISVEDSNIGKYLIGEQISSESTVAVDISSMNFWEVSDILYFLLKIIEVQKVDVFYTEPDLYHYENDNIARYNYPNPKVSVKYQRSYYSTKMETEEILVSMIGFQKNVNKLMKDIFEAAQYYSINGFPAFYPKAKDISQTNNADYLSEIEPTNRYSAEATNPFVTYNTLVDISKVANGAFMNICPLCSKPMTVGACLYALRYPDTTRIVYPYEETIATKSDGVGRTYCYSITQDFIS